MECVSLTGDGTITVRFTLKDRKALEGLLSGSPEMITLWRYLRTVE